MCITLDYNKIFQTFENIISEGSGGIILDEDGNVLFQKELLIDENAKANEPSRWFPVKIWSLDRRIMPL